MKPAAGCLAMALLCGSAMRADSPQLQVSVAAGQTTVVAIAVPVEFHYQAARESSPDRIVVDVGGAGLDIANQKQRLIPVGGRLVKQIRLGGTKPGTIRVVLDMAAQAPRSSFEISRLAATRGIAIRIGSGDAAPVPETKPPAPPPSEPHAAPEAALPFRPLAEVPPAQEFQLPERIGISRETPISLIDALYMTLRSNPDIQALRVEGGQSEFRSIAAKGVYDPVFSTSASFQNQTLPVGSSLSGSNTGSVLNRTWLGAPAITGMTPFLGGSYSVTFSSQRDSTDNAYATLNPSYLNALTFLYRQPLLRNLHYDASRHALEIARRNREVTADTFNQHVMELIRKTEQAYWELKFARQDLDVQLRALEIAHKQEDRNRRQLELGEMAQIDVVAAQTQLAGFEMNVYSAQDALTRAENNLKALMLGNRSAVLWGSALNPTTPPDTAGATPDLAEAVGEALAQRPEMAQIEALCRVNRADQRLDREQLKPQVDLIASYTLTGLAGRAVTSSATNPLADSLTPALLRLNQLSALAGLDPVTLGAAASPPSQLVGGYGQSLSRLAGDFPTAYVELRLSLPIGNRTAGANLAASLAEGRRMEYQRQGVEQTIEAEVRNAVQGIDSARERLAAARMRQQSAQREYESEARRFTSAASTLFLVQQRLLTMVNSISQVYRAEADLSEAVSVFELARGANYRRHNIVLK